MLAETELERPALTTHDTPPRLDRTLEDHAIDDVIVELLREVASHMPVEVCWTNKGEVALAAAWDAYGAIYVRRGGFGIALDRSRARRLQATYGLAVRDDGRTTARIQVAAGDLLDPVVRDLVIDIVGEALDRSYHGPRWSRRAN